MKLYCHLAILPTCRGRCPIQYNIDSPLSRHDANNDDTEFDDDDDDDDDDDGGGDDDGDGDDDDDDDELNAGAIACAEKMLLKRIISREDTMSVASLRTCLTAK